MDRQGKTEGPRKQTDVAMASWSALAAKAAVDFASDRSSSITTSTTEGPAAIEKRIEDNQRGDETRASSSTTTTTMTTTASSSASTRSGPRREGKDRDGFKLPMPPMPVPLSVLRERLTQQSTTPPLSGQLASAGELSSNQQSLSAQPSQQSKNTSTATAAKKKDPSTSPRGSSQYEKENMPTPAGKASQQPIATSSVKGDVEENAATAAELSGAQESQSDPLALLSVPDHHTDAERRDAVQEGAPTDVAERVVVAMSPDRPDAATTKATTATAVGDDATHEPREAIESAVPDVATATAAADGVPADNAKSLSEEVKEEAVVDTAEPPKQENETAAVKSNAITDAGAGGVARTSSVSTGTTATTTTTTTTTMDGLEVPCPMPRMPLPLSVLLTQHKERQAKEMEAVEQEEVSAVPVDESKATEAPPAALSGSNEIATVNTNAQGRVLVSGAEEEVTGLLSATPLSGLSGQLDVQLAQASPRSAQHPSSSTPSRAGQEQDGKEQDGRKQQGQEVATHKRPRGGSGFFDDEEEDESDEDALPNAASEGPHAASQQHGVLRHERHTVSKDRTENAGDDAVPSKPPLSVDAIRVDPRREETLANDVPASAVVPLSSSSAVAVLRQEGHVPRWSAALGRALLSGTFGPVALTGLFYGRENLGLATTAASVAAAAGTVPSHALQLAVAFRHPDGATRVVAIPDHPPFEEEVRPATPAGGYVSGPHAAAFAAALLASDRAQVSVANARTLFIWLVVALGSDAVVPSEYVRDIATYASLALGLDAAQAMHLPAVCGALQLQPIDEVPASAIVTALDTTGASTLATRYLCAELEQLLSAGDILTARAESANVMRAVRLDVVAEYYCVAMQHHGMFVSLPVLRAAERMVTEELTSAQREQKRKVLRAERKAAKRKAKAAARATAQKQDSSAEGTTTTGEERQNVVVADAGAKKRGRDDNARIGDGEEEDVSSSEDDEVEVEDRLTSHSGAALQQRRTKLQGWLQQATIASRRRPVEFPSATPQQSLAIEAEAEAPEAEAEPAAIVGSTEERQAEPSTVDAAGAKQVGAADTDAPREEDAAAASKAREAGSTEERTLAEDSAPNSAQTEPPSDGTPTLVPAPATLTVPKPATVSSSAVTTFRGAAAARAVDFALPPSVQPLAAVHATFTQLGSKTGRIFTTRPNLQAIPRESNDPFGERQAFVAPHGAVLVTMDYNQIELRILAHLSQDPALMKAFSGASAAEPLRIVAGIMFRKAPTDVTVAERQAAKVVAYGLIYGMGMERLQQTLAAAGATEAVTAVLNGHARGGGGGHGREQRTDLRLSPRGKAVAPADGVPSELGGENENSDTAGKKGPRGESSGPASVTASLQEVEGHMRSAGRALEAAVTQTFTRDAPSGDSSAVSGRASGAGSAATNTATSDAFQDRTRAARAVRREFFAAFPKVRTFLDDAHSAAVFLRVATTIAGRQRRFTSPHTSGGVGVPDSLGARGPRAAADAEVERQAVSTTIQGTAAEVLKAAMAATGRALRRAHGQAVEDTCSPPAAALAAREHPATKPAGGQGEMVHGGEAEAAVSPVAAAPTRRVIPAGVQKGALLLCVHDELVFVVAEGAVRAVVPQLQYAMEEEAVAVLRAPLSVPLKVSCKVGTSLANMAPWPAPV